MSYMVARDGSAFCGVHPCHQQPTFGLTFALSPFLQQPVLGDFKRHTGLGFDRCNRHLIRRWHGDQEKGAVDDIREGNSVLFDSSFAGREIANMGFHVAVIGHAQGNNMLQ